MKLWHRGTRLPDALGNEIKQVPVEAGSGATVTPATVAVTAVLPTPAPLAGASIVPVAVALVAALATPLPLAASLVTPAAISAVVAVPTPTAIGGTAVSPAVIPVVTALPLPTVQAASIVTPTVVATVAALSTPTVLAASQVTPAVVAVTSALPTPSPLAASIVTPAVVPLITTLPTPVLVVAPVATPAVVPLLSALPTPAVLAASTVTPAVVPTLATLPTPVTAPPILFRAIGAFANGANGITPALPAGIVTNDILLLYLETANQVISIANQNGGTWTEVLNSPQGQGTAGAAGGVRLTVFWSRYNGTQGAPTTIDSGDHNTGVILAYSGCVTSGDPYDATAGNTQAATTAGSIPGVTTTVDGCMIVAAAATDRDISTTDANATGWTNASLASITERADRTFSGATGGGLAIADGIKATLGAVSATTWTQAVSAALSNLTIALKPVGGGTGATVSPAVVPLTTALALPIARAVGVSTPAVVPVTVALPTPTIVVTQAVIVAPAVIPLLASLPTPTITPTTIIVTPAVIALVVGLPHPNEITPAGFEIPYLLGLGGVTPNNLAVQFRGDTTFLPALGLTTPLAVTFAGSTRFGSFATVTAAEKQSIIATTNVAINSPLANALDGVVDTLQFVSNQAQASGQYVQFLFPSSEAFSKFTMNCTLGSNITYEFPRNWEVLGSHDGVAWTQLATDTAAASGVLETEIISTVPYRYWRVQLTSGASGYYWRVNEFIFDRHFPDLRLTVSGSDRLATAFTGIGTFRAEISVNNTVNLAVLFAGTSTVFAYLNSPTANPRIYSSYMYHYVNVGVGFNPTDTYAGALAQTYPDGHTRNDFHEYLYTYLNIGVGFDPTDVYPGAPGQTFPDGHTRNDFHEYLYHYLNVVLGIEAHGQLTILPGFTRGPILPTASPPSMQPS